MKIHNVMSNIVGRTKTERIVSAEVWEKEIMPALAILLRGQGVKGRRALIGKWVVEAITNDEHLDEFFAKNWKKAGAIGDPEVRCYAFTGIADRGLMMKLLGLKDEAAVRAHRDSFIKALQDKKFRNSMRDPKLVNIDTYPDKEQIEIALFAPATVYCAEEYSFISLNTNYYGQLKSKSSLGPLEEFLIRRAKVDASGLIKNPKDVWLSMHAGCVEYVTAKGRRRGIAIIAPTGSGKSTHCYGLVEAKPENNLHSDDWVFVNIGTRQVLTSENEFYMRTNIAGIYPHLIPLLVNEPLENVPFTPDIVQLLEGYASPEALRAAIKDKTFSLAAYRKLIEQMVENNSARSLIDPRIMVGKKKFVEEAQLTDIFLMKRDYDSTMLLKALSEKEMVEVLTSKGNVYNYVYGKSDVDGCGILQNRTTEIYYNPYLCVCEVDAESGKIGPLDHIRIEAYCTLVRHKEVEAVWVNTRLATPQTQFCLRRFLEGGIDEIRLEKSKEAKPEILKRLGLQQKDKPAAEGRRAQDLIGLYDAQGNEVDTVSFLSKGSAIEAVAFYKEVSGKKSLVASWSEGTVEQFLAKYNFLGAAQILCNNSD